MAQRPQEAPCLFLTGPPQSGKTTLIREATRRATMPAGGFYTEDVRKGGRRVGFDLITLDGERLPLARVGFPSCYRLRDYGVDLEVMEQVGVPAVQEALAAGKLAIIDEVGWMEMFSASFQKAVRQGIEAGSLILGSVTPRPHPLADWVRRHHNVRLVSVSRERHDELLQEILQWIGAVAARAQT